MLRSVGLCLGLGALLAVFGFATSPAGLGANQPVKDELPKEVKALTDTQLKLTLQTFKDIREFNADVKDVKNDDKVVFSNQIPSDGKVKLGTLTQFNVGVVAKITPKASEPFPDYNYWVTTMVSYVKDGTYIPIQNPQTVFPVVANNKEKKMLIMSTVFDAKEGTYAVSTTVLVNKEPLNPQSSYENIKDGNNYFFVNVTK
jgi:hypothetical protein